MRSCRVSPGSMSASTRMGGLPPGCQKCVAARQFRKLSRPIQRLYLPLGHASACELLLFRKGTEAKPGLHRRGELAVARQDHAAVGNSGANGVESHPDCRHGPQIDRHIEVDVETRI